MYFQSWLRTAESISALRSPPSADPTAAFSSPSRLLSSFASSCLHCILELLLGRALLLAAWGRWQKAQPRPFEQPVFVLK